MAGRDLFSDFKPNGHVNKNSFDLSQKHVFSMRPGIISPVASVPVVPGDYFDLNIAGLIRSMTMNTAAFVRGKWHFDSVFVPYSQLWHPFNQFITQRNDKHSSLQKGTAFVPVINYGTLVCIVVAYCEVLTGDDYESAKASFPWAFDMHGYPLYGNVIRLLDMLGYGDFSWVYYIPEERPATNPYKIAFNAVGIMQILNNKGFWSKYVNIFALAAYQHSWYDLYRNKFYDNQDNGLIHEYVNFFNWDDVQCYDFASSVILPDYVGETSWGSSFCETVNQNFAAKFSRVCGLLSVRYHQWKKDRFTAMMPSAQFGSVSTYENTAYGPIYSDISHSSTDRTLLVRSDVSIDPKRVALASTSNLPNFKVTSVVDVMQLRKAELLQNWKQNALRAGNMTDDAMLAHYGEEPYYVADENVRFLGQCSSQFQVNPITASASTGGDMINGVVGDLAAQGKSELGGHCFKDSFKDFGVLQIYMYFVPEAEYCSNMLQKEHTRHEMFDFFTKELENIGLQPELGAQLNLSIDGANDPFTLPIGYNPPNVDYKTAVDMCHAGFADLIMGYTLGSESYNLKRFGDLSAWVAPRPTDFYSIQTSSSTIVRPDLASLYVNPNIFDKVFRAEINGDMNTDNFVCNVFLQLRAIRNMSVLGIPQF